MCQSCLTCIKPNRCLFSLHIRVLASITGTFYGFVSRIRAQVFLTLFQMNWPYVRITNVWSEQSTIQRWFHVFYSFSADKLIGPSSAFKAHFQKKKKKIFHVSVAHWFWLHCVTALLRPFAHWTQLCQAKMQCLFMQSRVSGLSPVYICWIWKCAHPLSTPAATHTCRRRDTEGQQKMPTFKYKHLFSSTVLFLVSVSEMENMALW